MPSRIVLATSSAPIVVEVKVRNADEVRELIFGILIGLGCEFKKKEWVFTQPVHLPDELSLLSNLNNLLDLLAQFEPFEQTRRSVFADESIYQPPAFRPDVMTILNFKNLLHWTVTLQDQLSHKLFEIKRKLAVTRAEKELFAEKYATNLLTQLLAPLSAPIFVQMRTILASSLSLQEQLKAIKGLLEENPTFSKVFQKSSRATDILTALKKLTRQHYFQSADVQPLHIGLLKSLPDKFLCALLYITHPITPFKSEMIIDRTNESLIRLFQGHDQIEKIQAILLSADNDLQEKMPNARFIQGMR